MPRHYQSFISRIAPAAATGLPTSVAGLAETGAPAAIGHFAQPDGFCAPAKVIPAVIAAITLAMWTPTAGVNAQRQAYDRGSIAGPEKAVITAAPIASPGWSEAVLGGKIFKFSLPEGLAAPPKLFPPAAITLNHWTSTDGVRAVSYKYNLPEPFSAPDKFGIIAPATVFLPAWTAEIGTPAKRFTFIAGDSSSAPPKLFPPASITLNHWTSTDGARAVSYKYNLPEPFSAPDKFGIIAPAVVLLPAWLGQPADPAKQFAHAAGATAAPEKTALGAIVPALASWLAETAAVRQAANYAAAVLCEPLKVFASTGPTSIAAQAAAIRAAMESLGAAVRPGIEALNATMRSAMEALSAAVRPAIDAQFAGARPAIDSLGGIVRPS